MPLKLAGETRQGGLEKIEKIVYTPNIVSTEDMETGTHTIVPTARPATGSAQYSSQLTMSMPADNRLSVKRLCSRLTVNISGLGAATHIYCSVRVDVDDADHELFTEDWTSSGVKLDALDLHAGNKATLFNLLSDGTAHTFYFMFWADAANQAMITVVQLWLAVGSCATSMVDVLEVNHSGFVSWLIHLYQLGSGSAALRVQMNDIDSVGVAGEYGSQRHYLSLVSDKLDWWLYGSVNTDLNYIVRFACNLKGEQ